MKDLRAMRDMAGITQFALSRQSGVSRMRLSLAECGETDLSPEEKERVTEVLLAAIQRQHVRIASVLAEAQQTRP